MQVELLYFDGCPGYERLLNRVAELLGTDGRELIELRQVASDADAIRERFLGSPTLRIDGRDVEPGAESRRDFGLKCRLYRTPGGTSPLPADNWIRTAFERAQLNG